MTQKFLSIRMLIDFNLTQQHILPLNLDTFYAVKIRLTGHHEDFDYT